MFRFLFSLDGRIGRSAYLLVGVGTRIATLWAAALLDGRLLQQAGLSGYSSAPVWSGLVSGLVMLACGWISFAAAVKRLHDQDRRGWWVLLEIPAAWLVYGVLTLVFIGIDRTGYVAFAVTAILLASRRGTPGPNRFGPEPGNPPIRLAGSSRHTERSAANLERRETVSRPPSVPKQNTGPIRSRPRRRMRSGSAIPVVLILTLFFASLHAMSLRLDREFVAISAALQSTTIEPRPAGLRALPLDQ